MIVRQKPSSLYQAPCSGASIALIGIDFRPETAEKIAPPCILRLDVDNCSISNEKRNMDWDLTNREEKEKFVLRILKIENRKRNIYFERWMATWILR